MGIGIFSFNKAEKSQMSYESVAFFLLMFVFFINVTGCSQDQDPKDVKISLLSQQLNEAKEENKKLIEENGKLNKQVGIGKKQYLEEDNMRSSKVMLWSGYLSLLLVTGILIITSMKLSRNKEMHEKEKIDLNEKNSVCQKLVLDLEHEIKQLKCALDDGEKNEVSNLLKTLRSERELRKHKIGGLNDK